MQAYQEAILHCMFEQATQWFKELLRRTIRHPQCIVEENDKSKQKYKRRSWPLNLLSMMTPQEAPSKYRVLSVLLRLEVQFKRLQIGHRASVRLYMKQTVITTWTD
jgi:hypothetical protein